VTQATVRSELVIGFEPPPRVPGGIARYTRELTLALEQQGEPDVTVSTTHVREWLRPLSARAWALGLRGGFGAAINVDSDARGTTSFHATSVLAPPRGDHPLVVTIHDTIPFTHPLTLTPHGASWHRAMITRAVHEADALVVPTMAVADSLLREFTASTDDDNAFGRSLRQRIHVGPGAASLEPVTDDDGRRMRAAFGLSERPYVVFVGTIEPRKGLDILIHAIASRLDLDLVIVGAQGWGHVSLPKVAESAGLPQERLIVTGAVHDSVVAAIIQGARALVLPSRAEGFGLPLIEAMKLRTPVVLSDDAALVEVAGGAGVVAKIISSDAGDAGDASRELNRALDESFDRKSALVQAGLRRSADFSWTSTAMRVTNLHRQLTSRS